MRFEVKSNKTSQFFFYLSNLSNWHFSCRPEYNKVWLKKFGPLNHEEKNVLKKLVPIFKKYGFDYKSTSHFLGKAFIDFPEKEIWKQVKALVNEEEFGILKSAFAVFEDKFGILWEKDVSLLTSLTEEVKNRLRNNMGIKKIIQALEVLFGNKVKNITIHIFAIPDIHIIGGGANTKQGIITLELGNKRSVRDGISVALHEVAHHLFRQTAPKLSKRNISKNEAKKMLKIPLFREQGFNSAWEELIILSLLPDGVLKMFLTNKTITIKQKMPEIESQSDLENFLAKTMKNSCLYYINKKKLIDQEYFNLVLKQTLEFVKLAREKK